MAAIEVGRKAVLLKGRRAGRQVKIIKQIDKNFVEVQELEGKAKPRKCNVLHIEPLAE